MVPYCDLGSHTYSKEYCTLLCSTRHSFPPLLAGGSITHLLLPRGRYRGRKRGASVPTPPRHSQSAPKAWRSQLVLMQGVGKKERDVTYYMQLDRGGGGTRDDYSTVDEKLSLCTPLRVKKTRITRACRSYMKNSLRQD